MKIRMKVDLSGTRNGEPWPQRGGVVELPDQEAAKLCKSGLAAPVVEEKPVETAVVDEDVEKRAGLTTGNTPAPKRGPGRPRKTAG